MADQSSTRHIKLQPHWKNHILGYILSVLLIPVFGLGLIGLYWVWKRQHRVSYRFTDTHISSIDNKYHRNVDLVNIKRIDVHQSWIQQKMKVGDLQLVTATSSMTLFGMEDPLTLKATLQKAISAQKQRQEQQKKEAPRPAERDPGTMDRMDYLTGLWQQGLMSDEDFEEERKHIEGK